MLPETESNGLKYRPEICENGDEYQVVGKLDFGSHAASRDYFLEMHARIPVRSVFVHR